MAKAVVLDHIFPNNIKHLDRHRRRAILISVIGAAAYDTLSDLCSPALPSSKTFNDLRVWSLEVSFRPQEACHCGTFSLSQLQASCQRVSPTSWRHSNDSLPLANSDTFRRLSETTSSVDSGMLTFWRNFLPKTTTSRRRFNSRWIAKWPSEMSLIWIPQPVFTRLASQHRSPPARRNQGKPIQHA